MWNCLCDMHLLKRSQLKLILSWHAMIQLTLAFFRHRSSLKKKNIFFAFIIIDPLDSSGSSEEKYTIKWLLLLEFYDTIACYLISCNKMCRYSCVFDIITFQSLTWKKYKTRWLYFKLLGQLPEDIMLVDGMISLVDWPVKAKKNPNLPAILGKEKPPPTSGNNPGRAKDRYMEKVSATTTPINNDNNYQQHTIITHTITKNIINNTITHVYNQEYLQDMHNTRYSAQQWAWQMNDSYT